MQETLLKNFNSCADRQSPMDALTALRTLREEKILSSSGGPLQSACEFLSETDWGDFNFSLWQGGPRPPVGHGWGNKSSFEDILNDPLSPSSQVVSDFLNDLDSKPLVPVLQGDDFDQKFKRLQDLKGMK
jgi:hypothetical protein